MVIPSNSNDNKDRKDMLHQELDRVVPSGTKTRSYVRMVGHALIELGLVNDVICSYEHCVLPSREFSSYQLLDNGTTSKRDKACATIDHVISISDGGTDLPSNLQLMHFACNSGKGARDAWSRDNEFVAARKSRNSKANTENWKNLEYREKIRNRLTGDNCSEETRKKRSEGMKRAWADPDRNAKLKAGPTKAWKTRRARG